MEMPVDTLSRRSNDDVVKLRLLVVCGVVRVIRTRRAITVIYFEVSLKIVFA